MNTSVDRAARMEAERQERAEEEVVSSCFPLLDRTHVAFLTLALICSDAIESVRHSASAKNRSRLLLFS
jgi:hypothetical protein